MPTHRGSCRPRGPHFQPRLARHGIEFRPPLASSADAAKLNPENVAAGAPEMLAALGCALVMTHCDMTTVLNDQSLPFASCSVTSKRLPLSARAVSFPAASPIAGTVMEKDMACGEKITPMCVASSEWSASAFSEKVGVNDVIGVTSTFCLSSSTYETARRVFQSAMFYEPPKVGERVTLSRCT